MKLKQVLATVVAMLAVNAADIQVEAQDWELLGERRVNTRAVHDVIPVGIQDGRFRTIQLRGRCSGLDSFDDAAEVSTGRLWPKVPDDSCGRSTRLRVPRV